MPDATKAYLAKYFGDAPAPVVRPPARPIWIPDEPDPESDPESELLDAATLLDMEIPPLEFVVGDLLPVGGTSLLSGAPKSGKTTLCAELAVSVANGGEWLGRKCEGASVAVLALEEHLAGYRDRMLLLGMSRSDPIYSHVGAVPDGDAAERLGWVTGILDRYRPGLMIIDTMAKLVRPAGGDFNEYGAAGDALAPFAELARARGVHLALVHHARKGGGDFGEQALGSTAWAGGVDTIIDLRRDLKTGARFVETQNRYGTAIEATAVEFHAESGRSRLAGHTRAAERGARIEQAIIDWLGGQPEGATLTAIRRAEPITGSNDAIGAAVRRLVQSGMLVSDTSGQYPIFMARA